jgi:hypothetical protein
VDSSEAGLTSAWRDGRKHGKLHNSVQSLNTVSGNNGYSKPKSYETQNTSCKNNMLCFLMLSRVAHIITTVLKE